MLTNNMLPQQEFTLLEPHFERVFLQVGATLFRPERSSRHVYLLTSGLASITCPMYSGSSFEVGLIGREGIPGSGRLLGAPIGPTQCVMQEAGTAFRMDFRRFQDFFQKLPELHRLVLQDVNRQAYMLENTSACNRVHSAEQRIARWLLMASDRVGDLLLSLTQDALAELLGTRRTTVTLIAGVMQKKGLIRYRRGRMQIMNRDSLAQLACECYPLRDKPGRRPIRKAVRKRTDRASRKAGSQWINPKTSCIWLPHERRPYALFS